MKVTHEINRSNTTVVWLTPPEIINALGVFDLDPCSPINRPWDTAKHHYTEVEDGLKQKWFGRVWCNPPYGAKVMPPFMEKMAEHNNGIALTFNRTETQCFAEWVFPYCSGILFKLGRIRFLNGEGRKVGNISGCGSILISYGKENAQILCDSGIPGTFVPFYPEDDLYLKNKLGDLY